MTLDTPSDQPSPWPADGAGRGIHPRSTLAADLRRLGVVPGAVVLVHSSMKALGYDPGGTVAVALALLDAVGPDGTLVVPTQTGTTATRRAGRGPPCPRPGGP